MVAGAIIGGVSKLLGSLFKGKSDALKQLEFQAKREDTRRPFSFGLLDPNQNPELRARLERGQNQFDFRQLAPFLNPRQVAQLNTMSPWFGVAGSMTGGQSG